MICFKKFNSTLLSLNNKYFQLKSNKYIYIYIKTIITNI